MSVTGLNVEDNTQYNYLLLVHEGTMTKPPGIDVNMGRRGTCPGVCTYLNYLHFLGRVFQTASRARKRPINGSVRLTVFDNSNFLLEQKELAQLVLGDFLFFFYASIFYAQHEREDSDLEVTEYVGYIQI